MTKRVILMVLDSLGVGALPDSAEFDDKGANTLVNIHRHIGGLALSNLNHLGLGRVAGIDANGGEGGCFGRMATLSPAKDTTIGHWELTGLVADKPLPTYPSGFPVEIIEAFENRAGRKTVGNYPCSGTNILKKLGAEHLATGRLIVYTSSDSVFQIAAHEDIVPLEELYGYCEIARELMVGDNAVGRIIARPFTGRAGEFVRHNAGRKDFSVLPPGPTLLDVLKDQGLFTRGIGKIGDIFGHRGLTKETHTDSNRMGMDQTMAAMSATFGQTGLIFTNLVDFDMVFGHRRDPSGYGGALKEFDDFLPDLMASLRPDDVLIITADHGCDPTFSAHTDHTREYVPILAWGESVRVGVDLGTRPTMADCGQTVADLLGVGSLASGTSFKKEIMK